jgi:hypothetical protein
MAGGGFSRDRRLGRAFRHCHRATRAEATIRGRGEGLLSCVISIAATIPLPDYTNHDISGESVYGLTESAVPAEASGG